MIKDNNISNQNIANYGSALAVARLFPTRQQVCHRMALAGINPSEAVVTGHRGEIIHEAGMNFLAAIRAEIGLDKPQDDMELAPIVAGPSLTTLCNTKEEQVSISDTLENIAFLLEKHRDTVFEDAIEGDTEDEEPVKPAAKPQPVLSDYARKLLARK